MLLYYLNEPLNANKQLYIPDMQLCKKVINI